MIRSCNLILCCFLAGLTLNATAQQSAPAASAPPPPVGTLAGHPDWSAAKEPPRRSGHRGPPTRDAL